MGRIPMTAERLVVAFKALPRRQKSEVLARLARERAIREDLTDLAIAESRRRDTGRPLRAFLREAHGKAA